MITLYLIRHAKSQWDNEFLLDIDRPLNDRGYRDADKMSLLLKDKGILPDLIISSPAVRALTTALIFSRNLNYNPDTISICKGLYDKTEKAYLEFITNVNHSLKSIMIFAHNPTLTYLANSLTKPFTDNIPTCGIVEIHFHTNKWKDIESQKGELIFFGFPKK